MDSRLKCCDDIIDLGNVGNNVLNKSFLAAKLGQ